MANKYLQKLVILGNSGCGKTSLMERYVSAKFSSSYKATIGADFSTKEVAVGDETITLQIWDTAGQERFQSLGLAFYRGADACVLVYDVSDAASFERLEAWRADFVRSADVKAEGVGFPFVVLGNKADLEPAKHVVDPARVAAWCEAKGGIPHFLVSAKTGDGVADAFLAVVTAASKLVKEEEPVLPTTIDLAATKPAPGAGGRGDKCAC